MSMSTFRTAVVRTPGGPDAIEIIDVPVAEPGPGEVRVEIAAAPVNPVDLGVAGGFFHAMGLIDQPERTGLGWDFAGIVVATGRGGDLAVGTRVAGLVVGFDRDFGTYAEQLVVPVADLAVVPDGLDLVAASTVPLNGLAAAQIVDLLGDAPTGGNRLLVTGAAGAVGGYVSSLAQDRGWRVTGLARAEDEEFVRGLGAGFTTQPSRAGTRSPTGGAAGAGPRPGPRRRGLRRRPAERRAGHGARDHRGRRGNAPRRPAIGRSARPHRVRRTAGPSARGRAAGPGRRRPPGHGEGRGARSLRAPALTDDFQGSGRANLPTCRAVGAPSR